MLIRYVLAVALAFGGASTPAEPAAADAETPPAGSAPWIWPVTGPVIRGFDPPDSPYGSGHRGIDVAAALGTPVLAPAAGVVTFAGPVGGRLFLTIDHGAGLESTYSWLTSVVARRGQTVAPGEVVATSGSGHTGATVPHLHMGARLLDVYVDPLAYLSPPDIRSMIRLAPVAS
jgi:murein DD-endopeptidase MepM/ murein hydrolase activator NlpD